jgi:predicted membrane channel-forming protein YqfA (hemolysin III family)
MTLPRFIPLALCIISILFWLASYTCVAYVCPVASIADLLGTSLFVPLGLYALCALLPATLAIFSPPRVYVLWTRSAIVWTLGTIVLALFVPIEPNGFFTTLPLIRSIAALASGVAFALLSTALIVGLSNVRSKD